MLLEDDGLKWQENVAFIARKLGLAWAYDISWNADVETGLQKKLNVKTQIKKTVCRLLNSHLIDLIDSAAITAPKFFN